MQFGSVCSGIEAASVAWHPIGWKAAWLAEIEPFQSAVLAHHHPEVLGVGLAGRTTWPSRRTGAGLADVIRRLGSWAVLELHLPELGIRSRRRHADG